MNVAGIICEYNPFHRGHKEQFIKIREKLGEDTALVCIMSGDFVQRGSPAVYNKHIRAKTACICGADLVLELPLPWCIASAEGFARAGVGLMNSLGIVNYIAFGSENGNLTELQSVADILQDDSFGKEVFREMETGLAFAPARQNVFKMLYPHMNEDILVKPNNILALEYLKALKLFHSEICPITTLRCGAEHDSGLRVEGDRPMCSASEIRAMVQNGEDFSLYMPEEAYAVLQTLHAVSLDRLQDSAVARLRMLTRENFNALPDATEGLGNRLFAACMQEPTLNAIIDSVKTKRYTTARIRRMLLYAALGIKKGQYGQIPPYARVLAASETGKKLIRQIEIPVITKPASVKELSPLAEDVFNLTAKARDFYVLGYEKMEEREGLSDWKTSPFML